MGQRLIEVLSGGEESSLSGLFARRRFDVRAMRVRRGYVFMFGLLGSNPVA